MKNSGKKSNYITLPYTGWVEKDKFKIIVSCPLQKDDFMPTMFI